MKKLLTLAILATLYAGAVYAYKLECSGDKCDVKCDSGTFVGTMYWNGSKWSDGVRSDKDKDEVAKQMVKAQGASCQ